MTFPWCIYNVMYRLPVGHRCHSCHCINKQFIQ